MTMADIRRVLVVDDDPDVRALLRLNLELSGYSVATAEDGIGGEEAALDLLPDLVVLDVMMPGQDGLSVLRTLKANELTREIPVVMLSAKSNDEDVWAGWQAGADYYLTKPFDLDQLMHFIDYLRSSSEDEGPA